MATTDPVYNTTTTTPEVKYRKWLLVPSDNLDKIRFSLKVVEVLLSLVSFTLEEIVTSCTACIPLYFFEFISCTAFLFTFLLLILLATTLHQRVGIRCWPQLDIGYTATVMVLFFISSIVFAAKNGGTSTEHAAVAFGFLASGAFLVDALAFIKMKGLPGNTSRPPENQNTIPVPESEKLNSSRTD